MASPIQVDNFPDRIEQLVDILGHDVADRSDPESICRTDFTGDKGQTAIAAYLVPCNE